MPVQINAGNQPYYSVLNLEPPPEGPKVLPLPAMDFSAASAYSINLQSFQQNRQFSAVQGIFVDNSANNGTVAVNFVPGSPSLKVAPNRQAYLTALCPNPPNLTITSTGNGVVYIELLNFPVVNHDWPAVTGA